MKKIFTTFALIIFFSGCSETKWINSVEFSGALKDSMFKGDISSKMNLFDLKGKENLYALGAVGNLKGEIQIFDSNPFISFIKNKKINIDRTLDKNASLIVYAQVKKWNIINIPKEIKTNLQFEKYLEKEAKKINLDTNKPFPFLLEGIFSENDWHIIDWDENDKKHSHQKHIDSGLNGKMRNEKLEALGFFSKNHSGIFIHHTTKLHIHYKTMDKKNAGHSDKFILGDKMILKLPLN